MAMSDTLFDMLQEMDKMGAEYPNHSETDQRFHALYRSATTAMRILQLYSDLFPGRNNDAFLIRAMELIQSNDQRPWEELREDLKAAYATPIVFPPDDQGRLIDLGGPTSPSAAVPPPAPTQQPPEELRKMHLDSTPISSREEPPPVCHGEFRQIYIPPDEIAAPTIPGKKKSVTAKPKGKAKAVPRSAKQSRAQRRAS